MDELIADFIEETNEGLAELDVEIVKLEQDPNDKELLGNIFRIVHTIKGTCGFLGLPRLEKLGHAAENVLGRFRAGELDVRPIAVSLIFQSLDRIKELLGGIAKAGTEPEGNDLDLIEQLNEIDQNGYDNIEGNKSTTLSFVKDAPVLKSGAAPRLEEDRLSTAIHSPQIESASQMSNVEPQEDGDSPKTASATAQSIRVHVDVLEDLMTMVSELVLTRNQLMQIMRQSEDSRFTTCLQRLNHVTSELQEGVMKTRMQPIGNAWGKLPRIIRDLSVELGKKIDLQMLGTETELDRQVLELIRDPLTHMVRNSADHGIEMPEERLKAGKPETGKVVLNAFHEGGHILIEISDDGKGLNLGKIKEKILSNGLASEQEIQDMTDQQIQQFIFKAGFSTAAKITNVSGRGVGMDVVRSNIEKISGSISLKSEEGKGSKFTIKIPLTLAIVSALIIESGDEKFAIPQLSVTELVRLKKDSDNKIEYIENVPVLRLRNQLLPLVYLSKILQQKKQIDMLEEALEKNFVIMVTKVGSYSFGIIVDRIFDTEEIVVKPVSSFIRDIPIYAGNTILGDGSVIMILDANGIAEMTGEISLTNKNEIVENEEHLLDERSSVLIFKAGEGAQKGVPLSLISRLEEFNRENIEFSDENYLIQYRNKLMPLYPLDAKFNLNSLDQYPVLVFSEGDKNLGLIVDEIKDIVQVKIDIQMSDKRPGIIGNCIINNVTTDFLDTSYFLTKAYPNWFEGGQHFNINEIDGEKPTILFVDDSAFFRNLLQPEIESAGYNVISVENAKNALKACHSDKYHFDVIITDIEMPEMNGFEFAREVKNIAKYKDTPLLALSAYDNPRFIEEGKALGFVDYVSKNNREVLAETLELSLSTLLNKLVV